MCLPVLPLVSKKKVRQHRQPGDPSSLMSGSSPSASLTPHPIPPQAEPPSGPFPGNPRPQPLPNPLSSQFRYLILLLLFLFSFFLMRQFFVPTPVVSPDNKS
jgi:hypothetical protein